MKRLALALMVGLLLAGLASAAMAGESGYFGTVVVTKSGFQSARSDPEDGEVLWRVHYGERFLCTENAGDGWYGIEMPTGETAYVAASGTALQADQIDGITMSGILEDYLFEVRAEARLDVYSQPRSSAKSRRVSSDGVEETTFYFTRGTEIVAFGKTTRGGADWYLLMAGGDNQATELHWIRAEDCEVIGGDPEESLIVPGWWYD